MSISDKTSTVAAALTAILIAAFLPGCIKNDIPYPRIVPCFTTFEVEHSCQPAVIDSVARQVTVYLAEDADIYNVNVTGYSISRGGHPADSAMLSRPLDLSRPPDVELELYQSYTWTIKAVQEIERYFTVANQVGSSVIDVPGHRVVATLPESVDLKAVKVLSIKLGSTNSTMSPQLQDTEADFTRPVEVEVTDYGRTETWTIYIETTQSTVTTVRVDPWAYVAWLYGEAEAGKDNGFEYRPAGEENEWIRVPDAWVTHNGGSFTARLIHLQSETPYEARAFSDDERGATIPFTTEGVAQLPNGSMDNWWLDGKVWNPWGEGDTPYWDTGNKGATTLGPSNSVPTDDTSSGSGHAAMLETKFVGIGMLGKLAAGNLFAGKYVKTDGTNGILSFGREFTLHPTRLTGFMMYHSAPISSTTDGFHDLKNRPDSCIIWCALIDSDSPCEIRTNPKSRKLFSPTDPEVVAYGKIEVGYDITSYTPFDITLDYVDTSRRPKYILVVASASKYGDYFTGGNGSVLYVDDFELQYDY